MRSHLILYVADQARSTTFYTKVLGFAPSLNVPGMTEFTLGPDTVLGLMPEAGIKGLLAAPSPPLPIGPQDFRAELYLVVDDPASFHARALAAGAKELSALALRDWGDPVAYSRDPDGYILAFAARVKPSPGKP